MHATSRLAAALAFALAAGCAKTQASGPKTPTYSTASPSSSKFVCPSGTARCGTSAFCCPTNTSCVSNPNDQLHCGGSAFCCFQCPGEIPCGGGCCPSGTVCGANPGGTACTTSLC